MTKKSNSDKIFDGVRRSRAGTRKQKDLPPASLHPSSLGDVLKALLTENDPPKTEGESKE